MASDRPMAPVRAGQAKALTPDCMATVAHATGHNSRSRLLGLAGRGLAAFTLATAAFLPTALAATVPPAQPPGCYVVLNQPPAVPPGAPPGGSTLIAFPSRDFVATIGYVPGMTYTVNVIRNGVTIGTSEPSVADATGAINVNHPGGSCWIGQTPNLRSGDLVRITDQNGFANQTTIANVTAQAPVVVKARRPAQRWPTASSRSTEPRRPCQGSCRSGRCPWPRSRTVWSPTRTPSYSMGGGPSAQAAEARTAR